MHRTIFSTLAVFFVTFTGPTLAQTESEAGQFDIHAVLTSALAESCPVNSDTGLAMPTVHDCAGFGPDFSESVRKTEKLLIERLHEARAMEAAARAETAVLAAQLAAEKKRRELQELQLENGAAVPLAAHFDVIEAIEHDYSKTVKRLENALAEEWDELGRTREALSLLQTEAAESCRRNEAAGSPLSICDKPGHQAALERKP